MPNENHLDVYEDRYELHQGNKSTIFYQGFQNEATQKRYAQINQELRNDYLIKKIHALPSVNFLQLSEENRHLLRNMVNGITSEVGRALVGLTFLQLTIKSIAPEQSIRLHKGTSKKGSFSWTDGISTSIYLFSFEDWLKYELNGLSEEQENALGHRWLVAVVESFAQKRPSIAPIDEPCDEWIQDLIKLLV